MKATLESLVADINFIFNEYGNKEHIMEYDFDKVKELFSKYEDKTWPVKSINDYIANIFGLLKLQYHYDTERKA